MTYLVFDLVIAALLLLAVWRGYQKGFVLALCGFLAIFVAFIGAGLVSNALADPVANAIQPAVERSIHRSLEEAIQHTEFTSDLPDVNVASTPEEVSLAGVLDVLQDSKIFGGLADAFHQAVDEGVAKVTTNAAHALADYIAKQIAQTVLFFLSFILILVLWFFVSHALDLACRLPVLSTLNQWGGAALGLFKGGLLLFIVCWFLKDSFLPQDAIENTHLLKFFCTTSPLALFF